MFGKFGGYFNPGIGKHYFLTESADGSAVRCDVAGECGGCGPNIQNNQPGDLTLRLMGQWQQGVCDRGGGGRTRPYCQAINRELRIEVRGDVRV